MCVCVCVFCVCVCTHISTNSNNKQHVFVGMKLYYSEIHKRSRFAMCPFFLPGSRSWMAFSWWTLYVAQNGRTIPPQRVGSDTASSFQRTEQEEGR